MKEYVVGFMFSKDGRDVALIRKNRPEWQAGKFNGVGGKIEPTDESPVAAMSREFYEETGVNVLRSNWIPFLTLTGETDAAHPEQSNPYKIYFFKTFSNLIQHAGTVTDEQIYILPADDLPKAVVPNLKFLVPMALAPDLKYAELSYA